MHNCHYEQLTQVTCFDLVEAFYLVIFCLFMDRFGYIKNTEKDELLLLQGTQPILILSKFDKVA